MKCAFKQQPDFTDHSLKVFFSLKVILLCLELPQCVAFAGM